MFLADFRCDCCGVIAYDELVENHTVQDIGECSVCSEGTMCKMPGAAWRGRTRAETIYNLKKRSHEDNMRHMNERAEQALARVDDGVGKQPGIMDGRTQERILRNKKKM